MFRWRAIFLTLGLPIWLAMLWIAVELGPDRRTPITLAAVLLALLLLLAVGALVLHALYVFAREAGGRRYALGQLALAIALCPFLFLGVLVVPPLVDSDVAKGIPAWRRDTAQPAWFVALDTLLVMGLLGLAVGLVATLGLIGLPLAAVLVPLLYRGFVRAARRRPV